MIKLPLLECKTIEGYLQGGSTYPVLVKVADGRRFVVKTFTPKQEEEGFATHKEAITNALAPQFDLTVPEPALVFISTSHIEQIKSSLNERGIKGRDRLTERFYFGSQYIEGSVGVNGDHNGLNFYEMQHVLAFDVLVENVDRVGTHKPNLLVKDGDLHLIDHELCFGTCGNKNINLRVFLEGARGKHILLDTIRARKKEVEFSEFEENLRRLNIQTLIELEWNLQSQNIVTNTEIISYLEQHKENPYTFIQELLALL
ncbi:MAG: HipA family kinase [Bacteroidota bacterium]